MNNQYGPPPGFSPPPFGYGPPPGAPPPMNPMNPMGVPPPPPGNNGLAVASLVCGILALFPGCCCGFIGIPLSVVAVVMGIVAMNQINASGGQMGGKNLAIGGLVCGGIAIAVDICAIVFNVSSSMMKSMHV